MSERQDFPANLFRKEYPDHAARVSRAVNDWYEFSLNQYSLGGYEAIRQNMTNFMQAAIFHPDDVFIGGIPFSFVSKQKRDMFINDLGETPVKDLVEKFDNWFNQHLAGEQDLELKKSIEQTAQNHIYNWLGGHGDEFKKAQAVWDEVDINLAERRVGRAKHIHPVSSVLIGCTTAAVVEAFMSSEYASKDLFTGLFNPTVSSN